ncbi:hypothetical protein GCM10011338_35690 [Alteromonas lipolytica]|nr:hypothetical protein GCM10011338_35690 [Alteromonas lipolytica]
MFSVLCGFVFPDENVETVNSFIMELEGASDSLTQDDIWLLFSGAIALVMVIVAYVGLFLFKSWGRHVFVASFVLAIPAYFMAGLWITTGLEDLLFDASMFLDGMLVALMYFSPVKAEFAKADSDESFKS